MIQDYLKAGYPALCILTQESERAEQTIISEGWQWYSYDCIRGIKVAGKHQVVEEITNPVEAIKWLNGRTDTVLIAHNLHLFMDIPEVIQSIQNGIIQWKATGSCLIIISAVIQIKPELEKLFHVIDFALPDEESLLALQTELGKSVNVEPDIQSVKAAKGLTEFEAETAFALSLVREGKFSTMVISETKAQMIRKSGLMEFFEPANIEDVGGLENLKQYIHNRARAFVPGNENLPRPKGILLVGIPGGGKSLSCKATASILKCPLIRLDIGALKNSLVGESEKRMRQATKVIDAFGQCVVFLDEVEKMFSGTKSGGYTDAGTTQGMFSHFLTWMNESNNALVMATANAINQLPPEFLRAGRFDGIFFVDLPTNSERREILSIMNRRYGTDIPMDFVEKLNAYTGSEIEQLVKDSLFDGLDAAYESLVPLSRTMREEIEALRAWVKHRARSANTPEETKPEHRKVRALKRR